MTETATVPNGLLGGIPVEILQLILTDDAFSRRDWRFCTRPVCRLWLDLVGGGGKEKRANRWAYKSQSLDKRLPHQRFRHGWGISHESRSCGLCVRAATMVEWAHMRPDLWDHQPGAFYRLCCDRNRSNMGDAAMVLMATGRAPLVDHVLNTVYPMIASMMAMGQRDAVNGKTDPDRCYHYTEYESVENIQDCLVDAAGVWGDLALVKRVIAAIAPAFVIHERVGFAWFVHSANISEYVMRAGVGFPYQEHLADMQDRYYGSDDDDDSNVGPTSVPTDIYDRRTWNRLASDGATDVFERLVSIALCASENPQDAFAQRIARTLAQNCKQIANNAVEPNSMGILRVLEPMMDEATVMVVMERACRSLVPSVLEWIVGVAKARSYTIPLFRLAKLAVRVFYTSSSRRPSPDTESAIRWLCAPGGGDYRPTQAEWEALMNAAMKTRKGDVGCALWLAERWPERLQGGHIPGGAKGMGASPLLERLVRLTCTTSTRHMSNTGATTRAMDRLVMLLDLCAERGVLARGSVDLWSVLVETIGTAGSYSRSFAIRMLKYACLRCVGVLPGKRHDYGDPTCPCTVSRPARVDATTVGDVPDTTSAPGQHSLVRSMSDGTTNGQAPSGESVDGSGGDAAKEEHGSQYGPCSTTVHRDGVTYECAFAPVEWIAFTAQYDRGCLEKLSRTWDAPVPASRTSWQRWCRARPIALTDLVRDAARIEDPSKDIRCVYYGFLIGWIQERLDSQSP